MKHGALLFTLAISIFDLPHDPKHVAVVLEDDSHKTTVIVPVKELDKPETIDKLESIFIQSK